MSKDSILFLSRTWKGDTLKVMRGHIPVKPALIWPDPPKSPAGPAAFPKGGGVVISIFFSRENPVKFTDPDGRDFNNFMLNILLGMMNGEMPTSNSFNNAFPTSNPGSIATYYAKADQPSNPFIIGEALNAGYKPLMPRAAAFHRQGIGNEYNIKMVHPDGREAIYNKGGDLVFDPINLGTKNDFVPNGDFLNDVVGHDLFDITPYLFWDNTRNESKGILGFIDRIKAGLLPPLIPDDYMQHWDHIYHPPIND